MKVYTRIVFDWDGNILESESHEYQGPLVLLDRALQQQAQQAGTTATQQAGNYGAAAGGVQANLVPRLEQQAVNPPGFGPFGLSEMETGAEQTASGATGAAQERARLSAMRTGNRAGLGAVESASAGQGARAQGSALQSILSKNAELKAQQMQQANQGLEGVLGEDIKGQLGESALVPEDINAAVKAGDSGWLQNALGIGDTAAALIKAIKGGGGGNSGGGGGNG